MAARSQIGGSTSAAPTGSAGRLRAIGLGRRAARGERSAFEQIFRQHYQELYRYCLAIVRDRDAALRSLPGESREINLRPWLFRVAHNESISLLRQRRTDPVDQGDVPEREGASPESQLATRDRLRRLVVDLQDLPERQRSAIVMRELSGLSYTEIGDALSCSDGGARQFVYEARTALREREEGRSMECDEVRLAISERDGRRLRGRKLRAHLSECDGCRGFAAAIATRRADLQSLCPPLPAVAAGTMLTGLLGSGGAATGVAGLAGAAGGGAAASLAIKGGSLAAAIAIAAGAADVSGLVDLPNPTGGARETQVAAPSSSSSPVSGQKPAESTTSPEGRNLQAGGGGRGDRHDGASHDGHGNGPQQAGGSSGNVIGTSQGSGAGNSATAPGQTGTAPGGGSADAPGQTGTAPGGGSADAPGQTGELPGNAPTAPGHSTTSPGNSASAPGQGESIPPGQESNPSSPSGNGSSSSSK
jgi:RNA polymerase sigma factor (sigma-70 family)